MAINDDDDDDNEEADCLPRYHNNRRPDAFWMGDGYYKKRHPRRRSELVSMRRRQRIHNRGDDIGDDLNDDQTFPITLVGKNVHDGGYPRLARFLPQSPPLPPINCPMFRGYHPYSRPIAPAAPLCQIRDNQPKRLTVATCCCCKNSPAAPIKSVAEFKNKIEALPMQMQEQQKAQEPEQGPSTTATTTTVTEMQQKSDEHKPTIENDE